VTLRGEQWQQAGDEPRIHTALAPIIEGYQGAIVDAAGIERALPVMQE